MRDVRGHHLFCMTLFSGHGYDQAFAENMAQLIDTLQAGESFRLVLEQDSVCSASAGQELDWAQARKRLAAVTEAEFEAVCQKCRWAAEGLCSFALLRERLKPEV